MATPETKAAVAALEALMREATHDFHVTYKTVASRWLQLVAQYETLGACKVILLPHPESWWAPLLESSWLSRRLHRSVEAAALRPEFADLFTAEERAVAAMRLAAMHYDPATDKYGVS